MESRGRNKNKNKTEKFVQSIHESKVKVARSPNFFFNFHFFVNIFSFFNLYNIFFIVCFSEGSISIITQQMSWRNLSDRHQNAYCFIREKEEIWLSPMTEALTPTEKSKKQRDNTKNATKNFDYTTIADRPSGSELRSQD